MCLYRNLGAHRTPTAGNALLRNRRLWTVILSTLLLAAGSPSAAQSLIVEPFDDTTLSAWTVRGAAAQQSGILTIPAPGGSVVHQQTLDAAQALTFEADLRFAEAVGGGPEAVLLFSQTDSNEPFQGSNHAWFFRVGHEWGTWSWELGRRNEWATTTLASGTLTQALETGTWYHLEVQRGTGGLSVRLLNQQTEVVSAQADDGNNNPDGAYTALFAMGEGQVDFDNFHVTGPEGETSPAVGFTAASSSSDEDAGRVAIAIELDRATPIAASVDVTLTGGSASVGADFSMTQPATINFAPGSRQATVTLSLIDDAVQETDETVALTLANPVALDLGTTVDHTLTIRDNDRPPACNNRFATMLPMWFRDAMPGQNDPVSVLDLVNDLNCTTCNSYTVTVIAGPGGSTDPVGSSEQNCDQTLTVTATANDGFEFSGWSGDATGMDNPLTLTGAAGDQTITANFQATGNGPAANAGRDQVVDEGSTVQLDGANSVGDALQYNWTQQGGPQVALQGANTTTPSFTAPDVTGNTGLTFQLTVTDSAQQTASDTVLITVRDGDAGGNADCAEAVLGTAPTGDFTTLTTVEISNDRDSARRCEPAWSSIPLPEASGLLTTDNLVLVDEAGNRHVAQFDIVSRWGAPVDDTTRPIRWLQVATITGMAANTTVRYSLRRYNATAPTDPNALTLSENGTTLVDTGAARFSLDPTNPALFAQIDLDSDGQGNFQTIYRHTAGAGPRLQYRNGNALVTLGTEDAGEVTVETDGFEIVERGPLKAVVVMRGRFSDPGGSSLCNSAGGYEAYSYTLSATFVRGSADIILQYHLRNECSDAFSGPWTDQFVTITQASWDFPFTDSDNPSIHYGGDSALTTSAPGFDGLTTVNQNKGGGTPWLRQAEVQVNGNAAENAEFFSNPMVALSDATFIASGQMPWMRYREPQGLAVNGRTISLRFVSESLIVGEGKGLWNFARLGLAATAEATAEQSATAFLEAERTRGRHMLERGLLVRASLADINASRVYPSLGTEAASAPKTAYLDTMNLMHDDTVLPGGQWDRSKIFGSQLWPESIFDRFDVDGDNPANMNGTHNYWNPQGAEMLEFLRSGDPKWVWDMALPAAWLQMHTAYLNIGDNSHGNRNGFAVISGGTGEGQWHRSAGGSDDYSYNDGMKLAYALRPNPLMRDRFRQAGRTIINRYDIPRANQAQREQYVNRVEISRQVIQHFEMLANCAEYVPGQGGNACHDRLAELLSELALDNLRAGIMCDADIPSTDCLNPQGFMMAGMMYSFFQRAFRNYGDIEGILGNALVDIGRNLVTHTMRTQAGQAININADWAPMMDCTLNAEGTAVVNCTPFQVDDAWMYQQNRPHVAAMVLQAHDLDPSLGMCGAIQAIYDDPDFLLPFWEGYIGNDSGWWKGAAQMMQGMVFGIGVYDTCSDP